MRSIRSLKTGDATAVATPHSPQVVPLPLKGKAFLPSAYSTDTEGQFSAVFVSTKNRANLSAPFGSEKQMTGREATGFQLLCPVTHIGGNTVENYI